MSLFIILVNKQEFLFSFFSNLAVMLFKFGAYLYTGSATMLSESIHSLADMLNQVCITYKEWCTWLQVVDSYFIRAGG